jgi:hypothetical protein
MRFAAMAIASTLRDTSESPGCVRQQGKGGRTENYGQLEEQPPEASRGQNEEGSAHQGYSEPWPAKNR